MINKDGGDNFSILWGGHRAHGDPPTRENPDDEFLFSVMFTPHILKN